MVVVAGAAGGGIGTTVTRMVAEAGATVIAVSRSKENLDDHIAPLIERGLSIVPVAADVATEDGIAAAIEQALRADGELHGLVNVAGGAAPADLDAVDAGDPLRLARPVHPKPGDRVLHEPGGRRGIEGTAIAGVDRVDLARSAE